MSKTVGKILAVAAIVVGVVAAIPTMGASLGQSAAAASLIGAGIAAATFVNSALLASKAKEQLQARQASVVALQFGEVPREGILGQMLTGGSLADTFNWGGQYGTDWECRVIALADHLCDGLAGFYDNDVYVPFTGDGPVAGYNGQLEVYWRPGNAVQTVPAVVLANGPGWTPSDYGAGVAWVAVCYKADKADAKTPVWPGGRPALAWLVRGKRCYQARKDTTVGGSGSHRWNDPSTWEWTDNLIDCRYNWVRGFYACDRVSDADMLLVGRGLSRTEAPPANVFAPANLCDELVAIDAGGTEKRYTVNGVIKANETYIEVEEHFAAACGGVILQPEGSVEIEPGQAKSPVFFFSDEDLLVGSTVEFCEDLPESDEAWVNTVVPRYVEPSLKFTDHAAPVRRVVADITADGGPREQSLSLALVSSGTQAGRVGEIARRLGRLLARGKVTLGPTFAEVEEGDWGVWTSKRYLKGASMLFRVEAYALDEKWHNTLTLRQISKAVYDRDADKASTSVALQQDDVGPITRPGAGAWALQAVSLRNGDVAVPALAIIGATDNDYADLVRFELLPADGVQDPAIATWNETGIAGPDARQHLITSVAPETSYYAAVSYIVGQRPGPRRILGPVKTDAGATDWATIVGPKRPADNATNSADPASPFGPDSTVGGTITKITDAQRAIDAAKARIDALNNQTIPAIEDAVLKADERITKAREDAAKAAADANLWIDAADRAIDDAVQDFAIEVGRAQGEDEALSRRIDAIVAEGGYDDTDVRALISSEATVRADDDRALGRRVDTVSASVKNGDDAVRADVKVTTDALARADVAFAEQAQLIEASLGTVDNRIAAKAQEVTTAYADADRALGRRIDSIVAEGGYDDRDVRAEIKRVDDTAIDRDGAIGRRVDTVQASFTSGGGNLLSNTDFTTLDGWGIVENLVGGILSINAAGPDWQAGGENALTLQQLNRNDNDIFYIDIRSSAFAVTAGQFLQFYAFTSSHRSRNWVSVAFFNADGAEIAYAGEFLAPRFDNGGRDIGGWDQVGVKSYAVPGGATSARLWLRKYNTLPGHGESIAWFMRPYIGIAREGQTSWNPYAPGSARAVQVASTARVKETTDALARADAAFAEQARQIEASLATVDGRISASASDVTRAFTNADIALGSRSTALEAAASFSSSSAVRNDNFNFWPDGQPNPANWITWSAQGNYRVERLSPGRAGGQYCVRTLNDFANVDSGFYQAIFTAGQGKWVVEVTVDSAANGLSGAGVSLHGIWNLDFCGDPDTNGRIGDSSPGEVRSWSKMFDLNAQDVINVHAMHGWSGFGRTIVPKYMTWHCLRLRPANDGEIKAGKADAALNNPGGVLARLTENAATLADLPNRYAATSRTAALEAQVNFATDSGLQRTINARIEDRATAIADSKTGAVAETVRILRGEYDGTTAEVRDQRGVINGLNGKTAAYVRLIADAGNGRASLSLWSDQYGGAWQLGGNGLIDGNLTINGTVTARAFNGPSMIREGQASWSGNVTPGLGQTVAVGWSLGLPTIPPVGRFIYEYTFAITTNAGQVQYAGQDRNRPVYYHYVEDGGGLLVSATDAQGNVYSPRANSSDRILATSDFAPTFTATVRRGSLNSVEDGGDYVNHYIAATYTLTSISLKVTWVAI